MFIVGKKITVALIVVFVLLGCTRVGQAWFDDKTDLSMVWSWKTCCHRNCS